MFLSVFNPQRWNSIPCRVFEKTHLRMGLIQGTSKDGFEAKITFVRSFFSKINIARSIISLVNRYGEPGKKLCHFTTCWGDSVFIFWRFSRISRARETFLCIKQCKTTQKYLQNPHLARKNINFKESQVRLTFM